MKINIKVYLFHSSKSKKIVFHKKILYTKTIIPFQKEIDYIVAMGWLYV